jgi:hypothetical protein
MAEQKVVELVIKANTSNVETSLNKVKNSIKDVNSESKSLGDTLNQTAGASGVFEQLKAGAFQLVPALKSATEAGNGLLLKMWQLVANPVGAIIAAIVVSLKFLYEAFQSSVAGGKELKAIFAGLDGVLTQAKDAVFGLGRAFIDLVAAGYKFITLDFKGAMESFNDATKEAKTSMKQLGDATSTTYKKFVELEKAQQKNDKARKIAAVEESKNNKLLVQSRDILTDETASIKEKRKALDEVTKSETKAANERTRIAKEDLRIITEKQKTLGGEAAKKMMQQVRDAQIAVNEAEAEGARNGIKLNRQRKMLNRQANADQKEADAEAARIKKEKETAQKEADKAIMDAAISLQNDKDKEILQASIKYNEDVAKLKKAGITDLSVLDESYRKTVADINKKYDDEAEKKRLEKRKKDYDEYQANAQGLIDESNRQMQIIANKDLEKSANEKLSFDARYAAIAERESLINEIIFKSEEEKTAFEKANADARKKIAKDEKDAKVSQLNFYAQALAEVANLIGENTDAGKAAAIASTTISTYLSAQKAYESQLEIPTPDAPFRAAAAAGLAIISGIANVNKIVSTPTPNGGGSGGGTPNASSPSSPSFNVVGTSGANQIAQTINQQAGQPIKAYVVSKDVTTAQSLDRNIVNSASM